MNLGRLGRLALARESRCDAEAGEIDPPGGRVNEHIGWLDVLVDEPASMELTECARQGHRKSEKLSDLHRLTDEAIERLASCVVDNEHASARVRVRAPLAAMPTCRPGTSRSSYSCVRRLRLSSVGCSAPEWMGMNACLPPSATSRRSLQKARSASRHSTSSESSSQPAPNKTDAFICPRLLLPSASRLGPGAPRCRGSGIDNCCDQVGILYRGQRSWDRLTATAGDGQYRPERT